MAEIGGSPSKQSVASSLPVNRDSSALCQSVGSAAQDKKTCPVQNKLYKLNLKSLAASSRGSPQNGVWPRKMDSRGHKVQGLALLALLLRRSLKNRIRWKQHSSNNVITDLKNYSCAPFTWVLQKQTSCLRACLAYFAAYMNNVHAAAPEPHLHMKSGANIIDIS